MSNRLLDLRLFRYALAAAEYGSFHRAALKLNVQQSSVSKGVRSLEHRIGAPLFERSHAGVRPTPSGLRFLQEATMGFDHLERAMQRIGAVQRGEDGELTVAISVPFFLIGDILEKFRRENPGVFVEIVQGTCEESALSVQQRKADVAFVTNSPTDGPLQSLHLRDERMIAVLPTSHRLAKAHTLMLEELRLERFILAAGGFGPEVAEHLGRHMGRGGNGPYLQLHRIGQCDLINMVASGFGTTIVIGRLSHAAPDGVVLVPLAARNSIATRAAWLTANANPALKGLLGTVRQAASGRLRDGNG